MDTIVFQVFESPEGGFEASALGHAIHTEGDTWDQLKSNVVEAVHVHFEETESPKLIRLFWTKEEVLSA